MNNGIFGFPDGQGRHVRGAPRWITTMDKLVCGYSGSIVIRLPTQKFSQLVITGTKLGASGGSSLSTSLAFYDETGSSITSSILTTIVGETNSTLGTNTNDAFVAEVDMTNGHFSNRIRTFTGGSSGQNIEVVASYGGFSLQQRRLSYVTLSGFSGSFIQTDARISVRALVA